MESRAHRPGWDAEHLGNLSQGVAHEVVQDEDRPFVRCEPSEPAIELVAIRDAEKIVWSRFLIVRQEPQLCDAASFANRLADAYVGEEPVDPGLEPVRIAEARKVTPGDHQRVLQSILGPIDVPEDPLCDREEPVTVQTNQVDERRLITALRRLDEIAIHRSHPISTPVGGVIHLYR